MFFIEKKYILIQLFKSNIFIHYYLLNNTFYQLIHSFMHSFESRFCYLVLLFFNFTYTNQISF